jgi:hypothetical protein
MTLLSRATPDFAEVEMTPGLLSSDAPDTKNEMAVTPPHPAGLIEIVLVSGVTLRVDAQVDAVALGRVLAVLDWRWSPYRRAFASTWSAV